MSTFEDPFQVGTCGENAFRAMPAIPWKA